MHVHGNVASGEEDAWARRLEREVAEMAATAGMDWAVRVEHVEKVKWYAPRVRHVVADVRCAPRRLATAWAVGVNAATSPPLTRVARLLFLTAPCVACTDPRRGRFEARAGRCERACRAC
jgi:hypothetical protein